MSGIYRSRFPAKIPIFAMLHLKGSDREDRMARARAEIDDLWQNGVDAIIVENYFGDIDDVVAALDYLASDRPEVVIGINVLGDAPRAFELANAYGLKFIQIDSVAGHLVPSDDEVFANWLTEARAGSEALVFGGVRFKYQPYLSGRSLREDLELGAARCDAIVVSGEGTGLITPTDKVESFRQVVGPATALIVGAGVTPQNAAVQLAGADGVIVGSTLKDTRVDTGDVTADHVSEFVHAVRNL